MAIYSQGFVRRAAVAALCALAWGVEAVAQDADLLANAGFEQYDKGLPTGWDLFVMPWEGASGSLDRSGRAAQGRNAILLSTAKPYEKEPFNNWNQNVLRDFTGKTLILKGAIRTEDATEASLWVQCWKKNPWTMLASKSSNAFMPVPHTADWTRVEVRLTAPRGTDYATVRCVLKGTGKAWFDDLSLTTEEAKIVPPLSSSAPPPPAAARAKEKADPAPAPPHVDPSEFTLSSLMGLLSGEEKDKDGSGELPMPSLHAPMPPIPPRRPTPGVERPPRPEAPQVENESVQELIKANRMLLESYQALKQTNAEMSEQLKAQQQEIQALRRRQRNGGNRAAAPKTAAAPETSEVEQAAPETPPAEPEASEPAPPPLVPSTTENKQ